MPVVAASGPATVIESGSLITFGGQEVRLLLVLPEGRWLVELWFHPGPEPAVHSRALPEGIAFDCYGFDGPDPRGSAQPVLLGELGDDLVFFHFRVARHGRSPDRSVAYAFYRASKKAIGWKPLR